MLWLSIEAEEALAKSLERFGLVEPLIVNIRDDKNTIVGGHQRFKILQAQKVKEIDCVTVDLSEKDEKLLNLTLNNPHTQGQFIDEITEYIEQLENDLGDDAAMIDLKIQNLKSEIEASDKLTYSEPKLAPYKKCHILLSFPPELFGEVAGIIEPLVKREDIEYEQSAN